MTKFLRSVVILAALVSAAPVAVAEVANPAAYDVSTARKADYGNEGTLLMAPSTGPDPRIMSAVEPSLMSIVFRDGEMAAEFYEEARGNGEKVCMSDLGAQHAARFNGQRYWLFSC